MPSYVCTYKSTYLATQSSPFEQVNDDAYRHMPMYTASHKCVHPCK